MKKLALLLLPIFGCCDPVVDQAFVLLHSVTRAEVECTDFTHISQGCEDSGCAYKYKSDLFLDGSSLSSVSFRAQDGKMVNQTVFHEKDDSLAATGTINILNLNVDCGTPKNVFSVSDGVLTVLNHKLVSSTCTYSTSESLSIDDGKCTGFNLAAFGLE